MTHVVIEVKTSNLDAPATDVTVLENPSTNTSRIKIRTVGPETNIKEKVGIISQKEATTAVRTSST